MNLRSAPPNYSYSADDHHHCNDGDNANPLRHLVASGCHDGNQRAKNQSADQSADVTSVVDAWNHAAQYDIDDHEKSKAAKR